MARGRIPSSTYLSSRHAGKWLGQGALWTGYGQGPTCWRATYGPVHQHGQFTTTACARVHRLRHRHTSTNTQTHTCTCIYTQKHTHKHRDTHRHLCRLTETHTHIYTPLLKQMHTSKPCVNLCQGRAPHIAKDGDSELLGKLRQGEFQAILDHGGRPYFKNKQANKQTNEKTCLKDACIKAGEGQTLTVLSADMENTLFSSKDAWTYTTAAVWPLSTPVGFLERKEQMNTKPVYLLFLFLFLKCNSAWPGSGSSIQPGGGFCFPLILHKYVFRVIKGLRQNNKRF